MKARRVQPHSFWCWRGPVHAPHPAPAWWALTEVINTSTAHMPVAVTGRKAWELPFRDLEILKVKRCGLGRGLGCRLRIRLTSEARCTLWTHTNTTIALCTLRHGTVARNVARQLVWACDEVWQRWHGRWRHLLRWGFRGPFSAKYTSPALRASATAVEARARGTNRVVAITFRETLHDGCRPRCGCRPRGW